MNQNLTHLFAEKRRKRFQISAPEFSGFSLQTHRFQRSPIPISTPKPGSRFHKKNIIFTLYI